MFFMADTGAAGGTADDKLLQAMAGNNDTNPDSSKTNLQPAQSDAGNQNKPAAEGADKNKPGNQDKPPEATDKVAEEEKNLESRLFGKDKPEEKAKNYERLYNASSKEAVRLKKLNDKISELLDKQGLELVMEDGAPIGFVPKKGAKGITEPSISFQDLPENIRDAFDSDPSKALQYIWDKARMAFSRVSATEDVAQPISEERKQAAIESLAEEEEIDGQKTYPDISAHADRLIRFINSPDAPRALKTFYHSAPELALKLIHAYRDFRLRQALELVKRETASKEKAKSSPTLGPSSAGQSSAGEESYEDKMGKAIAAAR